MKRCKVAVVVSCDTKEREAHFVCNRIQEQLCDPFLIDISTSGKTDSLANIKPLEVLGAGGTEILNSKTLSKSEKIDAMRHGLAKLLKKMVHEGHIDGVLGMGGLQNTEMCSFAMRQLPLGFPKVIVSTVASGKRYFSAIVGGSDIITIPSIVDFTGVNQISFTILSNAAIMTCALANAHPEIQWNREKKTIATTLMGITNDTVARAADILSKKGYEVLSFHSTGAGGCTLEAMAKDGRLTGVMDMTLHEMTAEFFGGYGFSAGADNRLKGAAEKAIPMVVCPGGINFICLRKEELFADSEARGIVWHNSDLAHVRLYEDEILQIVREICNRLNAATGKVTVIFPRKGLRTLSESGELFYQPDLMRRIEELFRELLNDSICFKAFDLSFTDLKFAEIAAEEMEKILC